MVTKRSSMDPAARPARRKSRPDQPKSGGTQCRWSSPNGPAVHRRDAGPRGVLVVGEPPRRPRWRERIATTLDLIRANPTGRIALKIFIAIAGALVVTVGIALIPLPGPGWLLVIAGLGVWAVEFHWARRLLGFTRRHVHGPGRAG